jgi:predicted nucleic acid-binding protein
MDKLFVDINIVLDVVLDREIDGASASVMNLIDEGRAKGFLSAASCPTIYYLVNKYLDQHKAQQVVKDILAIFHISIINDKVLNMALKEKGPDFEDNIQMVSAKSVKADFIITRNLSHYKHSSVKAVSPLEYLKKKL